MKLITDGNNVTEISDERWAAFEAFEKGQAKDWPQKGDRYYFADSVGKVLEEEWIGHATDKARQEMGKIRRTAKEVEQQVAKDKAEAAIRKYIRENGLEFQPDWQNPSQIKYGFQYLYSVQKFTPECCYEHRRFSPAYVKSEDDAQQVINNCQEHLKILFDV
mgnify:CR=1 FL=1